MPKLNLTKQTLTLIIGIIVALFLAVSTIYVSIKDPAEPKQETRSSDLLQTPLTIVSVINHFKTL